MTIDTRSMRFLVLVALAGCTSTRNPETCLEGLCPDPEFPYCDTDGSIAGEPNACIAVDCEANSFEKCDGTRALTCNATGNDFELVQCQLGCGDAGCEKSIVPKYAPMACDQLANETLTVTNNRVIDTSVDENCTAIVDQPTGPDLCLLKFRDIVIETNQTLKFTGTRGVALVADYAFDIKGTIDVSGDLTKNGPAGGFVKSGMMMSGVASPGAGYRHAGGAGGAASNGGPKQPSPLGLNDLFGGTQVAGTSGYGLPGGAGGALTTVSCRGKLTVSGLIDAGGGGGVGSILMSGGPIPVVVRASGGGSGGTIALQGLEVEVTGQVFANGGGGGSADVQVDGLDGQRSTTAAMGGVGTTAATGGNGGTNSPPLGGSIDGTDAGAGGASAGYILVYSPSDASRLSPTSVSPTIEAAQTVPTRE